MGTERDPAEYRGNVAQLARASACRCAAITSAWSPLPISNAGAQELGYDNTGAMWRSGYDMGPDEFTAGSGCWQDVRPLYNQLHCYVRAS